MQYSNYPGEKVKITFNHEQAYLDLWNELTIPPSNYGKKRPAEENSIECPDEKKSKIDAIHPIGKPITPGFAATKSDKIRTTPIGYPIITKSAFYINRIEYP